MDTDNELSGRKAMQTLYVDALLATALRAEAIQTGRTEESVFRDRLDIPTGALSVKVVDMVGALKEHLLLGTFKSGTSLPEIVEAAWVAAALKARERLQ